MGYLEVGVACFEFVVVVLVLIDDVLELGVLLDDLLPLEAAGDLGGGELLDLGLGDLVGEAGGPGVDSLVPATGA